MKPAYQVWPWSIYAYRNLAPAILRIGMPPGEYCLSLKKSVPGLISHAVKFHCLRLVRSFWRHDVDVNDVAASLSARMEQK